MAKNNKTNKNIIRNLDYLVDLISQLLDDYSPIEGYC